MQVAAAHNIRALLNQLTVENFDSTSDQITSWTNEAENEKDARVSFRLILVVKLVFYKGMDEATSEIYARLCRKLMEGISPKIQDGGIKDREGRPICGGKLFRKFLLNRCQEDFERRWVADAGEPVQVETYSRFHEEMAKRRRMGLIRFIGELFKVQIMTERVVHECVKRLLSSADEPEDMEAVCKLFTTVGSILDTQKASAFMDVYISRMQDFAKNPHVSLRLQLMLQDVIELRERKWMAI